MGRVRRRRVRDSNPSRLRAAATHGSQARPSTHTGSTLRSPARARPAYYGDLTTSSEYVRRAKKVVPLWSWPFSSIYIARTQQGRNMFPCQRASCEPREPMRRLGIAARFHPSVLRILARRLSILSLQCSPFFFLVKIKESSYDIDYGGCLGVAGGGL